MSEMAMFRDPATPVVHDGALSAGLMASASATSGATRAWMEQDYPGYAADGLDVPRRSYTGGAYVAALDPEGRYGVSWFLGTSLGADLTVKLVGRNYVTVGYTAGNFFQGYLQHRAFNSGRAAAVVGVGARHEYLTFLVPCSGFFCGPEKRVYSVGVRGFGLLRDEANARFGLKLGAFAGYIPYVRHPVLSLTLTAGGF